MRRMRPLPLFLCAGLLWPSALCAEEEPTLPESSSPQEQTEALVPQAPSEEQIFSRTPGRARILDLKQCLQLAEANFPKVQEARARLQAKQSQLREAYTEPFSQIQVTAGAGITPLWRGTSLYSPSSDAGLTSNMALAWQVGVEGMVPLWTFGKLTNLWKAADANVTVGKHEVKKEKDAIRLEVRRAYFGLQLARDSRLMLQDVLGQISKYVKNLEQQVQDEEADELDLLKLKMHEAELEARLSEAQKSETIARAGLRFFTGSPSEIDIPDLPLQRVEHELGPLVRYLEAARRFRPEINMVRAGITARTAQMKMEQARYFPDIGVAFAAKITRAAEITDQRNPFAHDPANYNQYGLALAMRWKLDFLPQSARIAKAQADLEEMRAVERFALGGIATEVEKAFAEAQDAYTRLQAWGRATQYAKQWLIKIQQGLELGLFDDEEIIEPAKEYALKKFSEMSAIYEYNLALAQLAVATGWEGISP